MMCIRRIAAEVKKSRQVLALPDGNRIHPQLTHRVFIREEMPLYTNTQLGSRNCQYAWTLDPALASRFPNM
jgi:hypothetical protein